MPALNSDPAAQSQAGGTDSLAHLARMSGTGSAFGQTEYVAINPLSIAAVLFGFASALALLLPLFLFVPIVGIFCGLLAVRQIRHSSGTQTGITFAIVGIVLSALLGGSIVVRGAIALVHNRADTEQCATVVSSLGQKMTAKNYNPAYELFTDLFRLRVNIQQFQETLNQAQANPTAGPIDSMTLNGENVEFQPIAESNFKQAVAMVFIQYHNLKEPIREPFRLTNREGNGWKIDDIPRFFPDRNARSKANQ